MNLSAQHQIPDRQSLREQAERDLDFCRALGRILFPQIDGVIPHELTSLWYRSKQQIAAIGRDTQ